jgi:hypothetical protein
MALAKPSALPAAQQRRREAIATLHPDPVETTPPAVVAVPPVEAVAPVAAVAPIEDEPVTLTRAELEDLRRQAAEADNARRAAEIATLEAAEARLRLTEAERARNEKPRTPEPLDLGFDANATEFTPEERDNFDPLSESFVVKVVRREMAKVLDKYNGHIDTRFAGVEKTATAATVTLQKAAEKSFMARVQEKVTDVGQLIGNAGFKNWMMEFVPLTNMTYDQALAEAHRTENLKDVVDLFDVFRKKVGMTKPSTAGYAGAAGSAALVEPVADASKGKRFTMTERKQMNQKLIKKQITQQEFDTYKAEFDKANLDGRVDP